MYTAGIYCFREDRQQSWQLLAVAVYMFIFFDLALCMFKYVPGQTAQQCNRAVLERPVVGDVTPGHNRDQ